MKKPTKTIEILDPVFCKASRDLIKEIAPCLKYPSVFYKPGQFAKKKVNQDGYFIDRRTGLFLYGLLPRVINHLEHKKIDHSVIGEKEVKLPIENLPELENITFRPDQKRILKSVLKNQRGWVKSPTGSGKTILACGLASAFPSASVLFLCHTKDLLDQAYNEFEKFDATPLFKHGSDSKFDFKNPIKNMKVIATIQSMSKIKPEVYCDLFDIIIVDEAHHACTKKGQYGTFLQTTIASIKIGFTATEPDKIERKLAMEGLLGPLLGELSIQEGIEKGILAMPQIKLIPVPVSGKISEFRKYRELYEKGIVCNRTRNRLIMKEAAEIVKDNGSCLIMIKDIRHGDELLRIGENVFDLDLEFVQGSNTGETRQRIKKRLSSKKLKCVICTNVWAEGINIPSLNAIINGAGGKSEINTLQKIGRGLRTAENKDAVIIIDFLDPYHYLASHSIMRIQTYVASGWL